MAVAEDQGYMEEITPVWYNFIVNGELNTWAVIATYDEEFNKFYLWTPDDNACVLTPDWKTDNKEDNIWGFFVSSEEEAGSCPYIDEQGWTYAFYTYDEETMDPISIVGPWGNDWSFLEEEEFKEQYSEWWDVFNTLMYEETIEDEVGEMPVWYNFIVSDELSTWAVIATYEDDFSVFYLWTPSDDTCILTPDWKSDDPNENIWGFFVSDWDDSCPFIEELGWTYANYTFDEETGQPVSVSGPYGNEWRFMEESTFS